MKFGTYFAYWEQEWEADYLKYCQKAAELGFDVLEVSAAGIVEMNDQELEALRKTAAQYHLTLTSCIGLPKEMDLASEDEATRKRGLAFMKKILDALHKADIHLIGGIIYAYWPADYSLPVHKEAARRYSIESVRELADYAKPYDITLGLETVNRFEHFLINDAAEATAFVQDIGKDNVKVMLDAFHMNIEEDSFGDAIRSTGKYLGHFHIGECNRKVPGKGRMPWDEIGQALRDIDYQGCVVMEPFVRPGGTIGKEIRVWRDLSGGADEAKLDEDIKGALEFVRSTFEK
ncbi:MAG: sugar phosphate isomerase/epimerase family protein [Blautia sp.]